GRRVRSRKPELWGTEPSRQSTGQISQEIGGGTRRAGRDLHGAKPRDGDRAAGNLEGWRGLSALGPGLPGGATGVHGGGCEGWDRVDAGEMCAEGGGGEGKRDQRRPGAGGYPERGDG